MINLSTLKIKKVTNLGKAGEVCDIGIPHNHNLFVCNTISDNQSVLAHNCPDMQLYGAEHLGLIPYLDYVGIQVHQELFDGDIADFDPVDLAIHTEHGDGICYNSSTKALKVELNDGRKVTVPKIQCYVITKKSTSTADIKTQLHKMVGLSTLDNKMDIAVDEVEDEGVPNVLDDSGTPEEAGVTLYVSVYNGTMALTAYESESENTEELGKYGFKKLPPYVYTEVKRASVLRSLIDMMVRKYKIPSRYVNHMEEVYNHFKKGRTQLLQVGIQPLSEFKQFYREKHKSQPADILMPYLLLEDDTLYLICDLSMHPASRTLKTKIKGIPSVLWETADDCWLYTGPNKAAIKEKIIEVNKRVGVDNYDDIKSEWKALKPYRSKVSDDEE